ncbi:MAG TPA: hypothetical protein VFL34_02520 [Candidatus Sulfotelmatobacter sp.]|nr:hypothetical protein [Candidatus Sulfotelmatobacter sp.]
MQRLTARFLLLFTLVGTFLPLALSATAAPPHACCLRRAAHQCHGSFGVSDAPAVRSTSCCNHDCCRGVHISQSAHPDQPSPSIALKTDIRLAQPQAQPVTTPSLTAQSSRAPPQISIA